MKRAALVQRRERQKVQTVSCPCCEARLALHFINGENAVYDVTLLGTTVDSQPHDGKLSRMEAAGQDFKDATTAHRVHDEKDSGNEVQAYILETSATDTLLDKEMREIQPEKSRPEEDKKHLCLQSTVKTSGDGPGNSKLFSLFYRSKKTVHLVRHGHTSSLISLVEPSARFDLRLTTLGHQQARNIAPKMAALKPEVILVSPLTRALQTLSGAFPSIQEPGQHHVEVTPLHAEHVMCTGDIGRPPKILAGEFPWLSFDGLPEVWWYSQSEHPNDAVRMEFNSVEPMEELRKRVGVFRQFLRSRPENIIVVIGHSTFFKELTSSRQRLMNSVFTSKCHGF
ncbi:uncharacterized protein [Physcomitrium patens]|uniref:uncharacterized protein n=1 Tax=Physcomitrium patens TaxID=3218 RepID=UPI000D16CCE5|nr:uncharacterized protein LOC112282535 [Physcomitrium patens]XP_024376003.1 uncharacterized protein LOC112282535 [Physcomitrium patens]XP_024376012.1 uncharacterized protein LOC112282535 [Physcomitrium patens]|eukprot:XP_024375993.1 uncharacterized protein LOC112282535 [Physcomitrella patens]